MQRALMTPGIHHVTMLSGDVRRSERFYRDVLGLSRLERSAPEPPELQPLYFGIQDRPGTLLGVLERPEAGRGRSGIGGVHHTALGVATEEGLLRWKRRLVDSGWGVSGPYDRGYFTSIYFRDPDGQILEIATEGPGYAVDEPADSLGGELVLPPRRIVRGHRDEAAIAALTHPEPVPEITQDMVLKGIHHVSGITDDLERAGEFYASALGLTLVKRTTNRDDPKQLHYFWASCQGGEVAPHSSFTLFGWPSHWNRARAGIGQTHHLAFRAQSEDDLPGWADRLQSLDVRVSPIMDGARLRGLRFPAPDGLLLEIAADDPGTG